MDAECQPERLEVNSQGWHEATPGRKADQIPPRRQDVGALIAGSDDPQEIWELRDLSHANRLSEKLDGD